MDGNRDIELHQELFLPLDIVQNSPGFSLDIGKNKRLKTYFSGHMSVLNTSEYSNMVMLSKVRSTELGKFTDPRHSSLCIDIQHAAGTSEIDD